MLAASAVLVAIAAWIAAPYADAAAFVLDLSGSRSWVRRVLPVRVREVATRDLDVPTRYGPIAARLYTPDAVRGPAVLVFPGIHSGGVDEPRLDAFSRRIASTGVTVVSVPLPQLRRYLVTPVSTDMIEDAALWMSGNAALAPVGRVTLAGVSFAGGLALVAAGRPSLDGKIESIVSLGAHADLPRVMNYLCTGRLPDEHARRPHDYGVAVILFGALPLLVPADQLEPARDALRKFLDASSTESVDVERAALMFDDARLAGRALPSPARDLMELVLDRNVTALGARLGPYVEALGGAPALSPDRSPATHAPVFLVHGQEDSVVPSSEAPLLANYLESNGNHHVRWLLTPLLSHADVQPPDAVDAWRLIRFWKDVLSSE